MTGSSTESSISDVRAETALVPDAEKRAGQLILLLFLAAITLPYVFMALITPSNLVWSGLIFKVDDQNVHLMWAKQVQDGAFSMRDLFTTEPLLSGERPLFFNLEPYVIGILSRFTGLEVVVWYHVMRIAAAAIGLWQFHLLSIAVTRGEARYSRARIIALFLVAFTLGGGFLGVLWPELAQKFDFIDNPVGTFPIMPEAFFSLSALIAPVNAVSMALLVIIFRLILEKRGAMWLFLSALVLSNIHTYDALPLIVSLSIWALWTRFERDRATFRVCAAAIAGALIPMIYQVVVFRGSEEFRVKALTVTAPPPLIHVLLSFLPLLLFMAWPRPAANSPRGLPATRLLWIWVVTVFALIYVPTSIFSFARKMMEGVNLPMCILAGLGLSALLSRFSARPVRLAVLAMLLLLPTLSTVRVWAWIGQNATENNASFWKNFAPPLSITRGESEALTTLNAQKETGAVLCLPFVGIYVPRATGKFTYLGHWAETLHFGKKLGDVDRFYKGRMNQAQAREFLARYHIRWVFFGPFERQIAGRDLPAASLGLEPIYQGGNAQDGLTTLYRVIGSP